jgi:hypothetical protein
MNKYGNSKFEAQNHNVLQWCCAAVKQGKNAKSETLNTKQYLNPKSFGHLIISAFVFV